MRSAGDSGLRVAKSSSASDTYISLEIPLVESSEKSEWSRQITRSALAPQVPVPLREQPKDLAMIGWFDPAKRRGPQGRDSDRVSVVRVVLVRPPSGEHPHARLGGRHVDAVLPTRHELLCQQVAQPAN